MRTFFRITEPYKFEYNDLRCLLTLINVVLIIFFGLSLAWFGLIVAGIGIVKDLTIDRRINGLIMHSANVLLNLYLLSLYYLH